MTIRGRGKIIFAGICLVLVVVGFAIAINRQPAAAEASITVYKSPT